MYKIKAKQGYNVIIRDLGFTLRSGGDWTDIDDESFDNSVDIKKFKDLIEIAEINGEVEKKEKKEIIETDNTILQVGETSFITRPAFEENPKDVFIAQPKGIDENNVVENQSTILDDITENTTEDVNSIEVQDPVLAIEETTKNEEVKETIVETVKVIPTETVEVKKEEEVKVIKNKKPPVNNKKGGNKAK